MYVMTAKISFLNIQDEQGAPLVLRRVQSVHIESSFKEMVQFAEIKMPRYISALGNERIKELFRTGDKVKIALGYAAMDDQDGLVEEFEGYITRVGADIPLTLRIEDEMWKAKRIKVNFVGKNVKLKDLLEKIAPGYEIDALEVKLGSVRFAKTNLGACLEKLASDWKLYSYFKGKKLVCGKYYADQEGITHSFHLEKNVAGSNLEYKNAEDVLVKIDATSINADGSKIEYSIGEEDGEMMSLAYYNIKSKAELEKRVKADYEKAKTGGFTGSFQAFGIPSVAFGDKAHIESGLFPDRNGEYYIEGVSKTFSSGGYRQDVELGGQSKFEGVA